MAAHPRVWLRDWSRLGAFGLAVVILSGCSNDGQLSSARSNDGATSAVTVSDRSVKLIERDVEAPEVFQVTDRGLWDGRPSLGGIWVAHPDVDKPERVIIRNTENSQFVIGALFRRERDNPGPILMVSSDAAAELGMLAGAPAKLNVTALRREEAPDPEAEAEAEAQAAVAAQTAATAAETAAVIAVLPSAADETAATADDTVAGAAAAISAAEAEAAPTSSDSDEALLVAAAEDEELDDSEKKYLQIGIFSQQSHAERTARVMTAAGMVPEIKTHSAEGKTFWRVVVGPADSVFQRTELLQVIKGEGFVEAFPVGG